MKKISHAYSLIALAAWLLIAGWFFADLTEPESSWFGRPGRVETQRNSAMAVLLAAPIAALGPIGAPVSFLLTSYAADGWRAPWDLSSWEDGPRPHG